MIKKIQALVIAVLAILILGALSAASAFSAPKWLSGGVEIKEKKSAVTEGKWLLLGLGIFGIKLHVVCEGKLVGTVGPGSEDSVAKAEGLHAGEEKLIDCAILSTEKGLCEGTLALVEAEHLPWKSELLEPKTGEVIDDFKSSGAGLPAFSVRCLLGSGTWSVELCEGEVKTGALTNDANGMVLGTITNQLSSKCNNSSNVSHVYGEGKTSLLSGAALTAD